MIRALVAGCWWALMALLVLVAVEVTLAVAAAGGWIRFLIAVLVAVVALFALPRMLDEVAR